jgi:hypothetical protein
MISCELSGGLGNNLFQLANAYSIAKTNNFDLIIPNFAHRGNIGIYGQSEVLEFSKLFENEFKYDNQIPSKLEKFNHTDLFLDKTDYVYSPVKISDNTTYCGYFQSEKYFLNVPINKEFILNNEIINKIKKDYFGLFNKKNISLHYRLGGDRVTQHMQFFHKNVSVDFYKQALEIVNYNPKEYNLLVFTDNRYLCEQILKELKHRFIIIDTNDNIIDFIFMSLCDINIIGNSTFSWWAAYMNQNKEHKVIAPKSEWFGPGYKHFNLKDTFPEKWITL